MAEFAENVYSPHATFADIVRVWAMFLYMASTLAIPRHEFYSLRLWFSALARRLAHEPRLWHCRADVKPPPLLRDAIDLCLANRPAHVVPAPPITKVSIVDSCGLRYGGIVCTLRVDGSIDTHLVQVEWDDATRCSMDVEHSVYSEPEGLARVAGSGTQQPGHLMLSDHQGFTSAFAFGSSLMAHYNRKIAFLRSVGVDAVLYTPGESMLADKYSRFLTRQLQLDDVQAAEAIARAWFGRTMGRAYRLVGNGYGHGWTTRMG